MEYGKTVVNMFVAIGMFFIMIPFWIHSLHESRSKLSVIFVIGIYFGVLYMFFSGYIYTTEAGPYLEQFIEIMDIQ